jgi:hypothetical protein
MVAFDPLTAISRIRSRKKEKEVSACLVNVVDHLIATH